MKSEAERKKLVHAWNEASGGELTPARPPVELDDETAGYTNSH